MQQKGQSVESYWAKERLKSRETVRIDFFKGEKACLADSNIERSFKTFKQDSSLVLCLKDRFDCTDQIQCRRVRMGSLYWNSVEKLVVLLIGCSRKDGERMGMLLSAFWRKMRNWMRGVRKKQVEDNLYIFSLCSRMDGIVSLSAGNYKISMPVLKGKKWFHTH